MAGSNKDVRKSERLNKPEGKEEKEEKDYVLPPPLHLVEKGKTSTPQKSISDEESNLNKDISEMEKSIQETEKQLVEIGNKKRVQMKKDKLQQMKKKLDRSQKKLKAAEEARRPVTVTILSDSMAKHVTGVRDTIIQSFPGATISKLQQFIASKKASINYKYTILLIGTNDIPSHRSVGEIMSFYENLITFIKSNSNTKLIVSAIIPRPCDLKYDPSERRVKDMNRELKSLFKRRKLQFVHTYIFVLNNRPIRSLFAVNDGGLHLNLESIRKLRHFFNNTVAHLK